MAYIPHTSQDTREMLQAISAGSLEELFTQIPSTLLLQKELDLPPALSESELSVHLASLSSKNTPLHHQISFMGAGAYDHYVPAVVDALTLRGEYFSAYTPYQAEASQGNLQVFFEFQTLICRLTGMEVANASLYDGATALAEAILMALSSTGRSKILLSSALHPEYKAVVETYLNNLGGLKIQEISHQGQTSLQEAKEALDKETACLVFQNPNFYGSLEQCRELVDLAREQGALSIVAIADPFSLSLVSPPGEYGVEIACGEAQSMGNPLSMGGPSVGFLSTHKEHIRKIPGRIVGETVDKEGKRAFVLTLQTREQHIRREKATSNICTNQALLALRTTIYLSALGKRGFVELGKICYHRSHYLAEKISALPGFELSYPGPFFREFAVNCPVGPAEILKDLSAEKILPGVNLGQFSEDHKNKLLIAVTEKNTKEQLDLLVEKLGKWK